MAAALPNPTPLPSLLLWFDERWMCPLSCPATNRRVLSPPHPGAPALPSLPLVTNAGTPPRRLRLVYTHPPPAVENQPKHSPRPATRTTHACCLFSHLLHCEPPGACIVASARPCVLTPGILHVAAVFGGLCFIPALHTCKPRAPQCRCWFRLGTVVSTEGLLAQAKGGKPGK